MPSAESSAVDALPLILAGPILRKTTINEVNLWLVTSQAVNLVPQFSLQQDLRALLPVQLHHQAIKVCEQLHISLLSCIPGQPLPHDSLIYYDILLTDGTGVSRPLSERLPSLLYPGQRALNFFIPAEVKSLFFGSCRNPHFPGKDTLVAGDHYLGENLTELDKRPCTLLHCGDQVYLDDIAGPMLKAIHQLIKALKLPDEVLPDAAIRHSDALHDDPGTYYNREAILPKVSFKSRRLLGKLLPLRKNLPVFSSVKSANHAISAAEVIGMYLLVWSPASWDWLKAGIDVQPPGLSAAQQTLYQQECLALHDFIDGLAQVRRLMAHLPNYMIFDDHDVTDDWNLTAQWEQHVYADPLGRRIISNALLGYWLFQGWGNCPERFDPAFIDSVEQGLQQTRSDKVIELEQLLLQYSCWHYEVPLDPVIIVLDTRTNRWRSEKSLKNPSGLMDWERLCALEASLMNRTAGIVVSPAPIFGVKLIETIQRIFAICGKALVVDAENWMAHPGAAKKLLDIFGHMRTPSEIVVLSGDVHYSFCFTARQRFKDDSTLIWQLTSSGIKNEFPQRLINIIDKLERGLYFAASPFNIFTKRRRLEIEHKALAQRKKQILIGKSNLGLVVFAEKKIQQFKILSATGEFNRFV